MSSTVTKAASVVLTLGFEMICGVIFGTPSRNCTGSGICMVTSIGHIRRRKFPCVCVTAYLSMSPEGAIYLRIPYSTADSDRHNHLFRKRIFEVDETFRIPPWLMSPWGKSSIFIPPGRYGIRRAADSWIIIFPVQNQSEPSPSSSSSSVTF